jgi:acetyl esterase
VELARLHPQARAALGAQVRAPLTIDNLAEVRASMVQAAPAEVGAGPDIRHVDDVDAGGVRARFYRDDNDGPVLVYAHGGGWVMGDLETHDGLCRHLARGSGWAVLAVDYRLAPEAPFPAAVEDVSAAVGWARQFGTVAVAGDSAGGHLAAVVARRERDAGRPVAAQVLICPVLDPGMTYPDLDDYGLDSGEMRFFWDAFAPPPVDRSDPDVNPFRAGDLSGLPPAVVITAELDVLRDEGERYAAALLAVGVPVVSVRHQGVNHNFVRKLAIFDAAHVALAEIATVLRRIAVSRRAYGRLRPAT